MISIIDTGIGNVASVLRMIEKVGGKARCISTPEDILHADKLILPGVGHFDRGMTQIQNFLLMEPLRERVVHQGVPLLGICLGMQLLCSQSEEGALPGLGFINAKVKHFNLLPDQNLKIPHMGWNEIHVKRANPLIQETSEMQRFYFVHAYYVIPTISEMTIASAIHGIEFCAAIQKDNIFGVQFHPEKSHRFGMDLMRRFLEL